MAVYNIPKLDNFNREFHLIKFFPKPSSYEFINVGVVIYDLKLSEFQYRLLSEDEIGLLSCSFIDKNILLNGIKNLQTLLSKGVQSISDLKNRYKNSFDTSLVLSHRSNDLIEVALKKLFNEYIAFKFKTKKKSKTAIIRERTAEILASEFKNRLVKIENTNYDFSLQNRKQIITNIVIGDLAETHDIDRAIRYSPLITPNNIGRNNIFTFGKTENRESKEHSKMLSNAKYEEELFVDEQSIIENLNRRAI